MCIFYVYIFSNTEQANSQMHKNVGQKGPLEAIKSSLPLRASKLLPYQCLHLMKIIQHFLSKKDVNWNIGSFGWVASPHHGLRSATLCEFGKASQART